MTCFRPLPPHQYIDRATSRPRDERLTADWLVNALYSRARESAPALFNAAVSARATRLLGLLNYDLPLGARLSSPRRFMDALRVDRGELYDPVETLDTPRKIFERRIRYWETRPLPAAPRAAVSPSDARALVGSLAETSALFVKEKFFTLSEALGINKPGWIRAFTGGDFAIFRLTPDKYHYNHAPVTGVARDFYEVDGAFHSCNPGAVVSVAAPYSKNRRVVTVIDTEVEGGARLGLVAMIEVVALMIGEIVQRLSVERYDDPRPLAAGMRLERGQVKSLFRPGSSTVILLFEPGRVEFCADLRANLTRGDAVSRFSLGFGRPLVETDVRVRSAVAHGVG